MTIDSIQEFQRKYESLAGHVSIVASDEGVAEAIAPILAQYSTTCVALAQLPDSLRTSLQQLCAAKKIELLLPPYAASDLPGAIDRAQVGISVADFAIAETGTLVEIATNDALRLISTLPRVHIALLWANSVVRRLDDSAPLIRETFQRNGQNCVLSFISGPSRSGDIEMKLTLGVHGPEQSFVVIIDESAQEGSNNA